VVAPVAAAAVILIEAVTELALAVEIVPLMPGFSDATPVAAARFVPVKVTLKVLPAVPVAGVTEVTVGTTAATVKGTE
jgi:hypothetical protein